MKLTISKSKNSVSFYVQKSIRKSNGTSTTITIEKLGNLEKVKARANGADPYEWARAYVEELNRREYEEQKEIIVSYSPSKLLKSGEKKSFNSGYLCQLNSFPNILRTLPLLLKAGTFPVIIRFTI